MARMPKKSKLYPSLISVLLAALLFGTSCFKDLQITSSASRPDSGESAQTVSTPETSDPRIESDPGESRGGFQPTDPIEGGSDESGPDTGPTSPPGESEPAWTGTLDWWSHSTPPLILRFSLPTPGRETILKLIDVPVIEFHNSFAFEALRGTAAELTGTLTFDRELTTAELNLTAVPDESAYDWSPRRKGVRHLRATVNFQEERITSLSFTNINKLADFVSTEAWLYEKLVDFRAQTQDFILKHLLQIPDEEDLYRMDIRHTLEQENKMNSEIVDVELNYEPVINFYNPRKELGETNQDVIQGKLQLSHDLLQGRLDVSRAVTTNNGKETATAQAWLMFDFSSGVFHRSDIPYEDQDGHLYGVDYPDAILYELAQSMRRELLAAIAGSRATDETVIVYD